MLRLRPGSPGARERERLWLMAAAAPHRRSPSWSTSFCSGVLHRQRRWKGVMEPVGESMPMVEPEASDERAVSGPGEAEREREEGVAKPDEGSDDEPARCDEAW